MAETNNAAEPGAGNIPIELDGKEMELVPSTGACIAISKIGGGLNAAVQRCLQLDMDTICQVIVAGLGLNPTQARQIPDAVYRTGLVALSAPCIDFINVVGNGGRPISYDEEEADEQADPPRPASQ